MPISEFLEADRLADQIEMALAQDPRRCSELAKRIGGVEPDPASVTRKLALMGPRALCGVAQQCFSSVFIYDEDRNLVADYYRVDEDGRIVLDRPDVTIPRP